MDKRITRNVRDLETREREVYESLLGEKLRENQTIILQVMTIGEPPPDAGKPPAGQLPGWCNVYEGLSEQDIADVESVALQRSDLSRPSQ